MKIKVFVVDDHQLFIDGLKALLKISPEIKVVGEAVSGKECIEKLENLDIDVLITDISMPEMNGDELVKIVKLRFSSIRILTLSMHYDYQYIDKMINAGTLGYILKNTGIKELSDAIRIVYAGKSYYSSKVQESIVLGFSQERVQNFKALADKPDDIFLTPRESEILKMIIDGHSSNEIADILELSYHTITSHRKNINAKLGTSSLLEMTRIANDKRLV